MSKMDDMRAMREARYQRAGATPPRDGRPVTTRSTPSAPAQADAAAPATRSAAAEKVAPAAAEGAVAPAAEGRCGHRAISGRTCTREQGHAAKSHRYA